MEKLTLEEAKELSQKKWEIIVSQDGDDSGIRKNPLFMFLHFNCGFCELHSGDFKNPKCEDCEINMGLEKAPCGNSCWNVDHVFAQWANDSTKENAQKVLDLINSVKI